MVIFWRYLNRNPKPMRNLHNSILLDAAGLLPWLFAVLAVPVSAQTFFDTGVELAGTDNLPRAQFPQDQFTDQSLTLRAKAGRHYQPGDYTSLNLYGVATVTSFDRFTGMNNVEFGLGTTLSHRFGLGDQAPTLSLTANVSASDYRNGNRDALNREVIVGLSRRITARWLPSLSISRAVSDGDYDVPKSGSGRPGNTWDQRNWSFGWNNEFELGSASWLSGGFTLRSGDIVSSNLPYDLIRNSAKAISLDTVFGEKVVAYRIDARTRIFNLDYNHVVGETGTWYAGMERQLTHGSADIDYDITLWRTGLLYSF